MKQWVKYIIALALSFALVLLLWRVPISFALQAAGRQIEVDSAHHLRWLALLPLLWVPVVHSLADLPWQQRGLSLLCRGLFLTLGVLGLSGVVQVRASERVTTIFLLDVSASISDGALEAARAYVDQALKAMPSQAEAQLIAFAARPRLVPLAEGLAESRGVPSAAALRELVAKDASKQKSVPDSDLSAALQLGLAEFRSGVIKHLVLLSDGRETRGDARREIERARAFGVKIFSVPPAGKAPAEVALQSLSAPERVPVGQTFQLESELFATVRAKVQLKLLQGDAVNGLDGVRELELEPGITRLTWKSVVHVPGDVAYKLTLTPLGDDHIAANNQSEVQVAVVGRPSVLYVEGQPQYASYFAGALTAQRFDVDIRQAVAFPSSLAELARYDFVVLSDVPASAIGPTNQALIERYISELGGGFLFAGGESGYALGGWRNSVVERLLPVRMDTAQQKETPGVALALVIDRSGSMSGLPLEMAKAACEATVGTLQGDDLIEVIAFDGAPTRYVKSQPARYLSRIQGEIARIQVGGGTAIFPALDAAYQDLSVVTARRKHVILLTDGRAESQGIRDLVQNMLSDSITVTAVGLGDGVDADLLRMIAESGGGRYHHAPDPSNLPRIFTRETEMVSQKSAVQDWFPVQQTANAEFLRGVAVESAPLLHGYVPTQMKPAPAQQVLAAENGDPILARWRVGLGYSLAWTSDLKNHWAVDWLRWPNFGRFFGQLVREHLRKQDLRELPMRVEQRGDQAVAILDAFTPDERFENGLSSVLRVTSNQSSSSARELPFLQVAPGHYEAQLPLDEYGSFALRASHRRENDKGQLEQIAVSYGRLSNPYPREYASFEPDFDLLKQLAQETGGRYEAPPDSLFDAQGERVLERVPLWPKLVQAMLALFFIDLLLRRLRLFDRKFSQAL